MALHGRAGRGKSFRPQQDHLFPLEGDAEPTEEEAQQDEEDWSDSSSASAGRRPTHVPKAKERRRTTNSQQRREPHIPTAPKRLMGTFYPRRSRPLQSGVMNMYHDPYGYDRYRGPYYRSPPPYGHTSSVPGMTDPSNPERREYHTIDLVHASEPYQPRPHVPRHKTAPLPGLYAPLTPTETRPHIVKERRHSWDDPDRYTSPDQPRSDRRRVSVSVSRPRTARTQPSHIDRKLDEVLTELDNMKMEKQNERKEKKEKEKAVKVAAERKRRQSEREAKKGEDRAQVQREILNMIQQIRNAEDQGFTGGRDWMQRTLPDSVGMPTNILSERNRGLRTLQEELSSMRQQIDRLTYGAWEGGRGGFSSHNMFGSSAHGLDVATRPPQTVMQDANFQREIDFRVLDALRRIIQPAQRQSFDDSSAGGFPRQPRNFPAEAAELQRNEAEELQRNIAELIDPRRDEPSHQSDRQSRKKRLLRRAANSKQESQSPEGLQKDRAAVSGDPWDLESAPKVGRGPNDSGYGTASRRRSASSDGPLNAQMSGARGGRSKTALHSGGIKTSHLQPRGQTDRVVPVRQIPQEDSSWEDSDGTERFAQRSRAPYAGVLPPNPPQAS